MNFKVGDHLYLYTARNCKFHVYEGTVEESKKRYYLKHVVRFSGRTQLEFCPTENEIGHILGGGPRLWLTERDDALARRLFLEYEEDKLYEMEKLVARKRELIRVLKEGIE